MIYILKYNKYKEKGFIDAEQVKRKLNADIENFDDFEKLFNKGIDIYLAMYPSFYYEEPTYFWGLDGEAVKDSYFQMCDEI